MLTIPTMDRLRELRLDGMARAFEEQLASSQFAELSFEERLGLLVDRELTARENRRLKSRLRKAKLRHQTCMEDIDYQQSRGLDKSLMKSLSTCQWVKNHLNVLITGPTGVGKSFIGCALGHKACLEGFKVFYARAPRLFGELLVAKGDGRYVELMNTIAKSHLLIIDDWGLSILTDHEQRDLLEILEDRNGIHSTIIASQIPVENWHEVIGNPTLADAIMDRLIHNAYKMVLKGESMRKQKTKVDLIS
jgi:DNA replication protein DnaC